MSKAQGSRSRVFAAGMAAAMAVGLSVSSSLVLQATPTSAQLGVAQPIAAGSRGPDQVWNTFTADVTIRRGVVLANQPAAERPAAVYHWQRVKSGAKWKTTMVVAAGPRPAVRAPNGSSMSLPPDISRIEDDGDGGGLRVYTRSGLLLRPPTRDDRRKMHQDEKVFADTDALVSGASKAPATPFRIADIGSGWIDTVLPSPARTDARKAQILRRFGKIQGQIRGLDRYLDAAADRSTEILVDAKWAVPVELNVTRAGQLQSRTTFAYGAGPQGSLLRRAVHVERVLAEGQRTSMDVELAGVRLEDRR